MSASRQRWLLALSLGLNLFLLGFGAARWWLKGPRDGRRATHALMGTPPPALRARHEELRGARREVGDALAAEPYDPERLKRALDALRAATGRTQVLMHERLVERAGTLSASDRRALARARFVRELPE